MMLFFDTETSGKYHFNLPCSDPSQPRIMQIAFLLVDRNKQTIMTYSSLIKYPRSYPVDPDAQKIHGISFDQCQTCGVSCKCVADILREIEPRINTICAHNLNFDEHLLMAFCDQLNTDYIFSQKRRYCTMEASTDILKLPGKIEGKYKWPKLQEVYKYFTGHEMAESHNALSDVQACKEIYFYMIDPARRRRR
jgi:DNA polymerase III epsilon subunit-like protein